MKLISSSTFRRPLACGCAVAACVALALCLYLYTASHSRFRVVGQVDPKTGYHIEYTVSRGFVKAQITAAERDPDMSEMVGFNPKPPSAALRWVYKHLLHRSSAAIPAGFGNEPRVVQYAGHTDKMHIMKIDDQGYVDLDTSNSQPFSFHILRKERRLISGCPTTFVQLELPAGGPVGARMVMSATVIHPRAAHIYYILAGVDFGDTEGAAALREAYEIAASARIVPGSAKR